MRHPRKIRFACRAAQRGFTLVELLVVIAIVGLLSTVAIVATSSAGQGARNQQRKANLLQISKALELYYDDHGGYPSTGGAWWGNSGSWGGYPDIDPSNYPASSSWIPGLTAGGYMSKLPRDPLTGKANPNNLFAAFCGSAGPASYIYRSNGTDYKVAADCLPEGPISTSDPFYDAYSSPGQAFSVYSPGARTWW